jgi:hypothetical protein
VPVSWCRSQRGTAAIPPRAASGARLPRAGRVELPTTQCVRAADVPGRDADRFAGPLPPVRDSIQSSSPQGTVRTSHSG